MAEVLSGRSFFSFFLNGDNKSSGPSSQTTGEEKTLEYATGRRLKRGIAFAQIVGQPDKAGPSFCLDSFLSVGLLR